MNDKNLIIGLHLINYLTQAKYISFFFSIEENCCTVIIYNIEIYGLIDII